MGRFVDGYKNMEFDFDENLAAHIREQLDQRKLAQQQSARIPMKNKPKEEETKVKYPHFVL